MTFLYFAYGSNLKLSEVQGTCPSARPAFKARLNGYSLVFPRRSTKRKCGVASVLPHEAEVVWGGVYAIKEEERPFLELREGYQTDRPLAANAYVPKYLQIFEDGDTSKPHVVLTFVANIQDDPPRPSKHYKSLIAAGANEWELPTEYVANLLAIKTL